MKLCRYVLTNCTCQACVSEVKEWMASNFLKLNANETEVLVIGFRTQLAKFDLSFMKLADADVAVHSNPIISSQCIMFDYGCSVLRYLILSNLPIFMF